jgi:acetyl esterase/lipase
MRTSALATLSFGLCLALAAPLAAQAPARPAPTAPRPVDPWTIRLWDGPAPGAKGTADRDIPTLTIYLPYGRAARTAVVVAPGGGYQNLAMNHEGRQVANWLNGLGITAFVLKYRLGPTYHHPIELGDAQRAIRIVRSRAAEFGVEPDRVGIMGFSAGGHLASTAATHFDAGQPSAADPIDRAGSRPDFLVLAYPVITADEPYRHDGSFRNLLGDHPDPALLTNLSNEKQVTADTPPTFLFQTDEDTTVPAENSVRFYLALRAAHVPAELHIFRPGRHGVGLAMSDPTLDAWPPLLAQWLRNLGLLTPPAAASGERGGVAPGTRE